MKLVGQAATMQFVTLDDQPLIKLKCYFYFGGVERILRGSEGGERCNHPSGKLPNWCILFSYWQMKTGRRANCLDLSPAART
jgi:hypothetical protein